ncbi:MAG: hypothetical protein JWQ27_2315 [Ferruginibacter sp.]|nr:hypothetical protein [Ferruginibacter sp.]
MLKTVKDFYHFLSISINFYHGLEYVKKIFLLCEMKTNYTTHQHKNSALDFVHPLAVLLLITMIVIAYFAVMTPVAVGHKESAAAGKLTLRPQVSSLYEANRTAIVPPSVNIPTSVSCHCCPCATRPKNEHVATAKMSQQKIISKNCAISRAEKKFIKKLPRRKNKIIMMKNNLTKPNTVPVTTIAGLRDSLGISQQTLAEYLGVPRSLLSHVELGNRMLPDEAIFKLAKLEGCYAYANTTAISMARIVGDQQQILKSAADLELRLLTCKKILSEQQLRLQEATKTEEQAKRWAAVTVMLQREETTAGPQQNITWLNRHMIQAERQQITYGTALQLELQLSIDLLVYEASMLTQYLEKLRGYAAA